MLGAGAELAPRLDLASLGNVAAQARGVLVVDLADLVDAEAADLAPAAEAPATAAAARPTAAARPAASATRSPWATAAAGSVAAGSVAERPITAGPISPGASAWRAGAEARPPILALGANVGSFSWCVVAHLILSFVGVGCLGSGVG